jgi:prophage regulatory protein
MQQRLDDAVNAAKPEPLRLLTWAGLKERGWPFSKMHTDRLEKAGKFPVRVRVGGRAIAWIEWEIEEHLASLPRVKHSAGGD